jgi:hypothetical protein
VTVGTGPRLAAFLRRVLLLALVLAAAPARAGELSPEEEKWVRDLLKALGANSPKVRKSAEEALARMGVDALPTILDGMPQLKGVAATRGLRRALEAMGKAEVVVALERMKQGLTKAASKRIDDLLAELAGSVGRGVPAVAALAPARLEAPDLVPLGAEARVEGKLPPALARGPHVAREEKGSLLVDADGDGSTEATVPGTGAVIDVVSGDRKVPVLVYAKRGTWMAASASLLRGAAGPTEVELLDADLDGEFGGAGDYVRFEGGAFGLHHAMRRMPLEDGLATYQVKKDAAGVSLALAPEPAPDGVDEAQWAGLIALNRIRAVLGLAPVGLDPGRSASCNKHARYLELNAGTPEVAGLGVHHETEGKPGYSPEGAAAASSSAVSGSGDTPRAMASFYGTMLHRGMLLGDAGFAVGIGSMSGGKGSSLLWGQDPAGGGGGAPLVVPAPGQRRVPLRGSGEMPAPDDPPGWYDQPRGFPVSAYYGTLGLKAVDLRLTMVDGTAPIPGRLWTHEKRVTGGHGGMAAYFMPEAPLEGKQGYTAVLSAEAAGRPVRWVWSFRTD